MIFKRMLLGAVVMLVSGVALAGLPDDGSLFPTAEGPPITGGGVALSDLDGDSTHSLVDWACVTLANGTQLCGSGDGKLKITNSTGLAGVCIDVTTNNLWLYDLDCTTFTNQRLDFTRIDGGAIIDGVLYYDVVGVSQYGGSYSSVDDGRLIMLGSNDNYGNHNLIITSSLSYPKDHGHDTRSDDPTLIGHSRTDPDTNNQEYWSITHDTNDMVVKAATGSVKVDDDLIVTGVSDITGLVVGHALVTTSTHTTAVDEYAIFVPYTATGSVAITLASATVSAGRLVVIKDTGSNATTNNITITTEGAETIDGSANYAINVDDGSLDLVCDGTNWAIR